MTKQEKKLHHKYYRRLKGKMGIFWFGLFKKIKPIEAYGFWVDSFASEDKVFIPGKLPYEYVVDIFCDLVARSKMHYGKIWNVKSPQIYYLNNYRTSFPLEARSELLLKTLLRILSECKNKREFFKWYKEMSQLMKVIY
jgi:hypothetical protein